MSPHEMSAASPPENACPNGSHGPGEGSRTTHLILPPNVSFSPITDDGTKPKYKYHQLIAMAILRSPMRRLTLKEIYKWISDTYSFYEPGQEWQNCVRHSLSMHKEFIKTKRQEGDPGLGGYWEIKPGNESKLLRKSTRKAASTEVCLISIRPEPSSLTKAPMGVPSPHPPASTSQIPRHPPNQCPEDVVTRSSDVLRLVGSSSDSSPVPRCSQARNRRRNHGLRTQSRTTATSPPLKRKFDSTDVAPAEMRPTPQTFYLTQMPELSNGRAEVEIARIRGSTCGSMKLRPPSYSPGHQSSDVGTNPPSTPAVRADSPPPLPSPSTSGRMRQNLSSQSLQSTPPPLFDIDEDNCPWSFFGLSEIGINPDINPQPEFDIFPDPVSMDSPLTVRIGSVDAHSPVNRAARRAPRDGSPPTAALADIPNFGAKQHRISTPLVKTAECCSSLFLEALNKACDGPGSPLWSPQSSPSPWDSSYEPSTMLYHRDGDN
ncbi:forkhead box protein L2 [Pochonia chlamydosporia 170]|uniref:Forkhead box protein L2 n=1 Tax=Pochonia chlamydosporia 170 TaxID=1380566 RepID=A0A179F0Y8_METCM|nr:forkhead box protein L2 [Pochonia chlamydosporia 170]OAQ59062.1 forkhead box protein L2 [Pochonia chlamydosporia 170]